MSIRWWRCVMNKIALAIGFAFFSSLVASSLPAGEVLEDVVEKRFPLDPSGTFSLRAIDGTVEIYGTDSPEVKIVATKKAFSLERLNAIAIRVDARQDSVNIETTSPPAPRHHFSDRSGTVEYTINVPQTARIARVELPHGELVIDGMRGASIAANLGSGRSEEHTSTPVTDCYLVCRLLLEKKKKKKKHKRHTIKKNTKKKNKKTKQQY